MRNKIKRGAKKNGSQKKKMEREREEIE